MPIISLLLKVLYAFIEVFCMYRVADILLPRKTLFFNKKGRESNWKLFLTLVIVGVAITFTLNQIKLTYIYTPFILVFYNIIIVIIFLKSDWISSTEIIGGYFFVLFVMTMIEISITGMIGGEDLIQQILGNEGIYRIIYLTINEIVWIVLNEIFYRYAKKHEIHTKSIKYIVILLVIGIVGFVVACFYMTTELNATINTASYVVLISGNICIFTMYYIVKSRNLKEKLQMMEIQNERLERNYEQVSAYYEANAHLYHDMKHHFEALQHMLEGGKQDEAIAYLTSLKKPSNTYVIKHWTGIDMIDTVMSDKVAIAEKKGIVITIKSQIVPNDIGVEKRDLCAIFSNLLDNAIEASPKEIGVLIKISHRMMVVQVKNDYQNELKKDGGRYLTTKMNSEDFIYQSHGWGLQSVEAAVKRYDGSMEVVVEEEVFCVNILLNI